MVLRNPSKSPLLRETLTPRQRPNPSKSPLRRETLTPRQRPNPSKSPLLWETLTPRQRPNPSKSPLRRETLTPRPERRGWVRPRAASSAPWRAPLLQCGSLHPVSRSYWLYGDNQFCSNLFVRAAGGNQVQNFQLALAEWFDQGLTL